MYKHIIILFYILVVIGYSMQKRLLDYCDQKYNCLADRGKHDICMYGCDPAKGVTVIENNFAFRNSVLYWHNAKRQIMGKGGSVFAPDIYNDPKLIPNAANIVPLSYNMGLEIALTCYLWSTGGDIRRKYEKCSFINRFGPHVKIEQLEYESSTPIQTDEDVKAILTSWFDEAHCAKIEDNLYIPGDPCRRRNSSQILWATTTHVGCARVMLQEHGKEKHYFVCRYAPAGVIPGLLIYKYLYEGKQNCSASAYPNSKWGEEFTNLCGKSEPWEPDAYEIGIRYFLKHYIKVSEGTELPKNPFLLVIALIICIFQCSVK